MKGSTKKKIAVLVALFGALNFSVVNAEEAPEHAAAVQTVQNTQIAGGKPWEAAGVGGYIPQKNVKDDFYASTNYEWMKQAKLPAGYGSYGAFAEAGEEVEKQLFDLVEAKCPQGHEKELIARFYHLAIDWDTRNKQGIKPLQKRLDKIQAMKSLKDVDDYMVGEDMPELNFIQMAISSGLDDASTNVLCIGEIKLTMDDSAEYNKGLTPLGARIKMADEWAVRELLKKADISEAEVNKKLENFLKVEQILAKTIPSREEMSRSDYLSKVNNKLSLEELYGLMPNFPLKRVMEKYGYAKANTMIVSNPAYLKALDEFYRENNFEIIRDYIYIGEAYSGLSVLDRDSYEIALKHSEMLSGASAGLPDRKYALITVQGLLGEPLSKAYAEAYCTPKMKADIDGMIAEVRGVYKEMLNKETFLSEETRALAIEKLDKMKVFTIAPEKYKNFDALDLSKAESFYDALKIMEAFYFKDNMSKLNKKVEHEAVPSFTVNAFYNPQENSINIPAGVLHGALYHEGMSREELLGGIGAVIGHEITHAFDPTGSQFDADGNFKNWWLPQDRESFDLRAGKLVNYYNSVQPWPGIFGKGELVKGEAIADMGGMKCMLAIAKKDSNFDYKKFFTQYANIWRGVFVKESAEIQNEQDEHPLNFLRVNVTLQQFDEFLKAFDIKPGDGMYLAPENRILVW